MISTGALLGRGYFYRSVSNVDDETVNRYVREDNDSTAPP